MAEPAVETKHPLTGTQSNDKGASGSEAILGDILDTMHNSEVFPRTGKDAPSRFWSTYERMAKQHDDEFLERHNGDMDVLLIFAGLFSAVSSAFIVNMESGLSPNPSDTTNALLRILINKVDNGTFSDHDASLPVWNGPSSTIVWIQALAYASLSTSLLAAFGAVLGKQWLGHFKTSRFGRGTLHERCKRRQQKLDGMESWHFSTIMATLPIFLQLSLLFFGIALAANIWIQQHTIASVIMATTAFGAIFYFFTVVASLKSPDCPFQTPVSTIIERAIRGAVSFRKTVRKKGEERPQSWAGVLDRVLVSMKDSSRSVQDVVTGYVSRALVYISRIPSALMRRARLLANDPESTGSWQPSESLEALDLSCLDSPVDHAEPRAIQWIIETSTDTEVITAAVMMIPEVEWPEKCAMTIVLDRLEGHFHTCFDPTRHLIPLTQQRAEVCIKAISHVTRATGPSIHALYHGIRINSRRYSIPRDQGLLLVHWALGFSNELDIASLPSSERMWLAHMFTHSLQECAGDIQFLNSVTQFIHKCFHDPKTQTPRLVADCLLLSGLMIGLRPEPRHLAKIDKSTAILDLQRWVTDRMLDLLLGEPSVSQQGFRRNARQLLWPLAHPLVGLQTDHKDSIQWLKVCFQFLADERPATEGTEVRFNDVAATIRHSLLSSPVRGNYLIWLFLHDAGPSGTAYWIGRPDWHTPAQFDLLVNYLLRVCEGTDYDIIGDTFVMLASLHGSPSTLEHKRLYIEAVIRCMSQDTSIYARHAAMSAASSVRTEVALLGQDDESFRELFSRAVTSASLARDPDIQQQGPRARFDNTVFHEPSLYTLRRDVCYLTLLCAFAQEPAWHDVLDRDGHIKTCLTIADKLSSWKSVFNLYAVHIAQIFAILDALGDNANHQILSAIEAYPTWPLVVRSWGYIFHFSFFIRVTVEGWKELSGSESGALEALPLLLAYAMRHWRQWDNRAETEQLLQLVTQVCDKLLEEKQKREGVGNSPEHGQLEDELSDSQVILDLGRDIRSLLETWE